jgi:HlyD family secretion protein
MGLWQQQIGTKADLEEKGLVYQNSRTNYYSALLRLEELRRQLEFSSSQARKNLMISSRLESDYTVRSEIDGIVFDILKSRGELIGPQVPLAIIGNPGEFILEMQVDEYDIFKISKGLKVLVSMDSYKGRAFEAEITKIYPIMNERSKTFLVEARFVDPPKTLYPQITFEANIILRSKEKALLIPRNCMVDDSTVIRSGGERVKIRTGLKDLEKVEVLSGITAADELIVPKL